MFHRLFIIPSDSQWADDENTILIDEHFLANIKLQANIKKYLLIYITCQNIFDVQFIDRKNRLSPVRFLLGGIKYSF